MNNYKFYNSYLIMNKIKAKLTTQDQFSPWEESFINLVRSFGSNGRRPHTPLKRQYLTLDNCKGHKHEKVHISKRELGRSILNPSKINLRNSKGSELEEQLIIQQKSSRYQGPRLTFYSKMNPKCSEGSSQDMKSTTKKSLRYSFYESQNTLLPRESSIKYLDILQEHSELQRPKDPCKYLHSIYPINTQRSAIIPRKQQNCHNMKRFKILFNSRKMSNNP